MKLLAGFDPGGKGRFGWALAEWTQKLPLRVKEAGLCSNAEGAVQHVLAQLAEDDLLLCAGIDAPLFWSHHSRRIVDDKIRKAIANRGCNTASGTVQNPNSLQGACVIQGPLTMALLRLQLKDIRITESHPKALLWLLGIASSGRSHDQIRVSEIGALKTMAGRTFSEDERDSMLGMLSAWAAFTQPADWMDLLPQEGAHHTPVPGGVEYWMPTL